MASALTTAAGVAGGMVAGNMLMNAFGGSKPAASEAKPAEANAAQQNDTATAENAQPASNQSYEDPGHSFKEPSYQYASNEGYDDGSSGFGDDEWVLGVIPTGNTWRHLIQPAFVLAAVGIAMLARITRTSMLETMRLDHVRTARAKGLGEKQVMRKHVLRNAMIPVITILGIDFGTMVGAAVLTETVFNLPGLGSQIVQSAKDLDMPVVLGLTMIVMFVYGLMSLLVDLSYAYFNPRVRLGDD